LAAFRYWITSSAVATSISRKVSPRALAVQCGKLFKPAADDGIGRDGKSPLARLLRQHFVKIRKSNSDRLNHSALKVAGHSSAQRERQ
jgi:hypothetical protein